MDTESVEQVGTCLTATRLALEYVAAQVGHEDITTTNRIYRYVLRRKVRGEIGERRRQLTPLAGLNSMARPRIELGTPRFSVVCSTN
jgi:hypothetical protein